MAVLNLTKEEREAIHKQHEEATKQFHNKKAELKKGLQSNKKEEEKKD